MPVNVDLFRSALSHLAAGVSVISTARDGERRGVTATAVCSVSASPPTILVCINTATGTSKMIEEHGWFAVNVLAEQHRHVAEVFAGRNGLQGDERFRHGDWEAGEHEALPLLSDAIATLECRVDQIVRSGTHAVFFGIVELARLRRDPPLIYHAGAFHMLPSAITITEAERLRERPTAPAP